jgi:hypothetical protein
VIVAGTKGGHVTWFISQPPQKTYSILYSDQTSHAPNPIVALQVSLDNVHVFKNCGYRKGTFSAHEKIMRISQNGPLEKFTRFLFMRLNVACIANVWHDNIFAIQIYATAA